MRPDDAGARYRAGIVSARPTSGPVRWLEVNIQWRYLIGLRTTPPTVTAGGDLEPGDPDRFRAYVRSLLEYMLRRKEG